MAAPMRVTVNTRILVHLLEYVHAVERDPLPPAVTQLGMSIALGVRRSHVTAALQALARHGFVEDRTARILGGARRKKAYALTPLGYERAQEARPYVVPAPLLRVLEAPPLLRAATNA